MTLPPLVAWIMLVSVFSFVELFLDKRKVGTVSWNHHNIREKKKYKNQKVLDRNFLFKNIVLKRLYTNNTKKNMYNIK